MNDSSYIEFSNFSPEGRLHQIEYALEAIKLGSTIFGIKCNNGIILAVEKKRKSKLIENESIKKLIFLNKTIGCCISGLTSDGRLCVDKIRVFLENNYFLFNNLIDVEKCAKKIRDLIFNVTSGENGELYINRPLGIAFLLCGLDQNGIHLFTIDPSGNFFEKNLVTLGNGHKDAAFVLREGYRKKMKILELEILAVKCMRVVIESQITDKNLEIILLDYNKKIFTIQDSFHVNSIINDI